MAPQTGLTNDLGGAQFAGARLAVELINSDGGVLGQPVSFTVGTDVGTGSLAQGAARSLVVGAHADAVVGTVSAGTDAFNAALKDNGVVQCLPESETALGVPPAAGSLVFGTFPSDAAAVPVLASQAVATGAKNVAIVYRTDPLNQALDPAVTQFLSKAGLNVVANLALGAGGATVTQTASQVVHATPDDVVLLTFSDGAEVAAALLKQGVRANHIILGPGAFVADFATLLSKATPGLADGITAVGPGGEPGIDSLIAQRAQGNLSNGAQAFDCATIVALAAVEAHSVDPAEIARHVVDVTRGTQTCTTFGQCALALSRGQSISYQGPSGPLALGADRNPTTARYIVAGFVKGAFTQLAVKDGGS